MTAKADQIRKRRRAFATPGSLLDKILRVAGIVLPCCVGIIAAFMLITPLSPRSEVSFLLDRNKVAIADDRLRIDNAMYRGEDEKGQPFSLLAVEAVQKSNSVPVVDLNDLTARILLPEGQAVLNAASGFYKIDEEQLSVPGILRFTAGDGYEMSLSNVTIDLPSRTLSGTQRVRGVVPAGAFSADRISVDLEGRRLMLNGNAHLQMTPGKLRVPETMK